MVALLAFNPILAEERAVRDDPRVKDAVNLLERWIEAQREYEQIPGISMAVVHDQELVWSAGFGYADLESQRPAGPETIYSICSISKLFTSVAVMQLRDEGRLRLDDRVDAHLEWFQLAESDPRAPPITIKGLLTHSAGIPVGPKERPGVIPYLNAPTRDELKAQMSELEVVFPAWEHYLYSNLGMALLGEIIAEVSGRSYRQYVQEEILSPLGMEETTPDIGDIWGADRLATGYSATRRGGGREKVPPFEVNAEVPAKGFASTVGDLAKFASWQFRLLEKGEREILDANTLREMQRINYVDPAVAEHISGLGFYVLRMKGKLFVGHAGDCPGYRSTLLLQINEEIATIGIANAVIPIWTYTEQAYDVLGAAIRNAEGEPDGGEEVPAEFAKYIGVYDAFPFGGEFQIVPWNGGIAFVRFPSEGLLSGLKILEHIEGDTFRRGADAGHPEADVVFEMDSEGRVVRLLIDSYALPRME